MRRATLILLSVALTVRIIAFVQHILYGLQGIPFFASAIPWGDFDVIYTWQLGMLQRGFMLYRDIPYSYPPLFIYFLYPFYQVGGKYAAAIPIVVLDATSVLMIYYLVKNISTEKVAKFAALAYALSPLPVFNEGYLWLSSQPMTFFVLVSVYFASRRKAYHSMAMLASATLFKQEAVAIVPIVAAYLFRNNKQQFWKALVLFIGTLVVVSLPFLLTMPTQYLSSVSFALFGAPNPTLASTYLSGLNTTLVPHSCTNVSVNAAFPSVAVCGNVSVNMGQLDYLQFFATTESIARILSPLLFLIIVTAIVTARKHINALPLTCAFGVVALLLYFSTSVHSVFGYYFVPVYALLYASSLDGSTIGVVSLFQILSLISPGGELNITLSLCCVLLITVLSDRLRYNNMPTSRRI